MKLPDTTDTEQMAHVGRMSVLFKARRETVKKLRDLLVPVFNNIEGGSLNHVKLDGAVDLIRHIEELDKAIEALN